MSAQLLQAAFMNLSGQKIGKLKDSLNPRKDLPASARLYHNLCREEMDELSDAFEFLQNCSYEDERRTALIACLDGAADLLYVLAGFCNSLGLPLEYAFQEVHASNMAKAILQPDGTYKVILREDGKTLKPEGWIPPNLDRVIDVKLIQDAQSE